MTTPVTVEPHRVQWRIDNSSEPYARFTCSAPEGALCRSWCAEGCDEVCTGPVILGPTGEPIAQAPLEGHRWEPIDHCRVVTYLGNWGTAGELYMGENDEPLRSGPIETEWDGDSYLWQYADAAEDS